MIARSLKLWELDKFAWFKTRPLKPTIAIPAQRHRVLSRILEFPYLNGFSINCVVNKASATESTITPSLTIVEGASPTIIHEKEINGQCHKYKGKLIKPNQIRNLCDNIFRLIQALGPAIIINIVLMTGIIAQKPGYTIVLSNIKKPKVNNKIPKREYRWQRVSLKYLEEL